MAFLSPETICSPLEQILGPSDPSLARFSALVDFDGLGSIWVTSDNNDSETNMDVVVALHLFSTFILPIHS